MVDKHMMIAQTALGGPDELGVWHIGLVFANEEMARTFYAHNRDKITACEPILQDKFVWFMEANSESEADKMMEDFEQFMSTIGKDMSQ